MSVKILMGNEAIAQGAIEAGVQVATGYPGTPSSEILTILAKAAKRLGFYAEWSVNEKVALEVGAGAALSGARTIVTMKQVGLNVAADPLMTLAYLGVVGGLVIVVADDPGPHSSQNEQDTRLFARFAKLPILDPATPQEAKDMTRAAFELSEKLKLPVILRPTTRTSHACQDVEVEDEVQASPRTPRFERNPLYVCLPRTAARKHPWLNAQQEAARKLFEESPFNEAVYAGRTGIIGCGVAYNYVMEALQLLGAKASVLKLGTPYPLPEVLVAGFLSQVDRVLVVEELEPFVEEMVVGVAYRRGLKVEITGKTLVPREGELNVNNVHRAVAQFLGVPEKDSAPGEEPPELPLRPPILCAGCPHRASFYTFKEVVQEMGIDAVFSGDIGCYTLGFFSPLNAMDTCLCMGASIGMAAGMHRAEPGRKHIAFLGDSTFFHSGITGLIDAVYNDTDITVVVLDNSTTAMTGHQPHPGMGVTAQGDDAPAADIAAIAKACGVKCIREADPMVPVVTKRMAIEAINHPGPSLIVLRHPCAAVKKHNVKYRIKSDLCSGCTTCVYALGCPAITLRIGRPVIIADKCAGCGFCARICPPKAIERVVEEQ